MINSFENSDKFYFLWESNSSIVKFQLPLPDFRYTKEFGKLYLTQELESFIQALDENLFCSLRLQDLKILLDDELILITYYETDTTIEIKSVAATRYQLRDVLNKFLKFIRKF